MIKDKWVSQIPVERILKLVFLSLKKDSQVFSRLNLTSKSSDEMNFFREGLLSQKRTTSASCWPQARAQAAASSFSFSAFSPVCYIRVLPLTRKHYYVVQRRLKRLLQQGGMGSVGSRLGGQLWSAGSVVMASHAGGSSRGRSSQPETSAVEASLSLSLFCWGCLLRAHSI